jgi:hypothetical protein
METGKRSMKWRKVADTQWVYTETSDWCSCVITNGHEWQGAMFHMVHLCYVGVWNRETGDIEKRLGFWDGHEYGFQCTIDEAEWWIPMAEFNTAMLETLPQEV